MVQDVAVFILLGIAIFALIYGVLGQRIEALDPTKARLLRIAPDGSSAGQRGRAARRTHPEEEHGHPDGDRAPYRAGWCSLDASEIHRASAS